MPGTSAQQLHAAPQHVPPSARASEFVDVSVAVDRLYRDGIVGLPGAFDVDWVDRLAEDVDRAFRSALARPGGTVGRGPNRHYVEVHPEELRGFVDLVTHPWVTALSRAVVGDDYEIVEVGFDVPLPGAVNQPWHRDFEMPPETRSGRLSSLAFNITTVDVTDEMGPFEIAPGTQWDDDAEFDYGMFPPRSRYSAYEQRAVRKYPRRGDISARSALAIHRGTANRSHRARAVVVLGIAPPDAESRECHDMAVSAAYWERLPREVRDHLHCRVVERLEPVVQKHTIEGLVMGAA